MELLFKKKILGASPQIVRKLIKEMMSCIETWHDLEENEEYELRLIINELIVNGIIHGNRCFCNKMLTVVIYALDNRTISICIEDEGKGFNYKKIEEGDFPCDSILFSERGRGLKIVRAICDSIQFNHNGSKINVRKSLGHRPMV